MGNEKMKKNSNKHSILYLASMQTTRVLLVILILMTIAELGAFYLATTRASGMYYTMKEVFNISKVFWISKMGCFLYCLALIVTRIYRHGTVPAYTLARLNETDMKKRVENYIYNFLCILVLWGSLVATYFGMYLIYTKVLEYDVIGRQTWVLTIIHTPYLLNLMPMCFVDCWITLIVMILGTTILTAESQRAKIPSAIVVPVIYLFVVIFIPGSTFQSLVTIVLVVLEYYYNDKLDVNNEKGDSIETSVSNKL